MDKEKLWMEQWRKAQLALWQGDEQKDGWINE